MSQMSEVKTTGLVKFTIFLFSTFFSATARKNLKLATLDMPTIELVMAGRSCSSSLYVYMDGEP